MRCRFQNKPGIDRMAANLLTPTSLRSSTLSTASGKEGGEIKKHFSYFSMCKILLIYAGN